MSDERKDEEYAVICTDCKNPSDPAYVMGSVWYKQGQLPPCQGCGGVTVEIPVSEIENFRDRFRNGERPI